MSDGLRATVDRLVASLKSPNPYERVSAARILAARAAEFSAQERRVVAALEALIDAEFDPRADWVWEAARAPR